VNAIEAKDLHKHYGEVVAVDGIDLTVATGEVTAVLGPNGAGKTTTIEMLLGLTRPTRGTVTVLGGDPHSPAVRRRVGAMLQDTDAPESLTVAEMVDLVAAYYPTRLPTPEVLERADLRGQADRRVTQLSGGQRQRLSFALAIAGDPDLLFLDEPTAALDVGARRAFWEQVSGFASLGKTILFSTHNLAEADEFAERVVVFHAGRVIADGTPHEVKQLVPGRTVSVTTDAPDAELRALPSVRGLEHSATHAPSYGAPLVPRPVRLQVVSAEDTLQSLFRSGRTVTDLTVTEASLEDAFVHLTSGTARDLTLEPTR
jgi:ABC-2 type transport system ATP-binding protein